MSTANKPRSLLTIRLPKSSRSQTTSGSNSNLPSTVSAQQNVTTVIRSRPVLVMPSATRSSTGPLRNSVAADSKSSLILNGNATSNPEVLENGGTNITERSLTLTDETSDDQLLLAINATNIWFGGFRITPAKPVIIADEGVVITCRVSSFIKNKEKRIEAQDDLFQFLIGPDDLINCYSYFGGAYEHLIFLMVFPNCISHLRTVLEEKLREYNTSKTEEEWLNFFCDSCLITIFTPPLARIDISQLMYLMSSLGKSSVISSDPYHEIGKKAALNLLCNIRPPILNLHHFNDSDDESTEPLGSRQMKNSNTFGTNSLMDCSVVLEKVDLQNFLKRRREADPNKDDDRRCHSQLTSDTSEIDEISLNEIHSREEFLDDGFQTEVIELNDADTEEDMSLVIDGEMLNDDNEDVSKSEHKALHIEDAKRKYSWLDESPAKKIKVAEKNSSVNHTSVSHPNHNDFVLPSKKPFIPNGSDKLLISREEKRLDDDEDEDEDHHHDGNALSDDDKDSEIILPDANNIEEKVDC